MTKIDQKDTKIDKFRLFVPFLSFFDIHSYIFPKKVNSYQICSYLGSLPIIIWTFRTIWGIKSTHQLADLYSRYFFFANIVYFLSYFQLRLLFCNKIHFKRLEGLEIYFIKMSQIQWKAGEAQESSTCSLVYFLSFFVIIPLFL